jgi:hypothetical protein
VNLLAIVAVACTFGLGQTASGPTDKVEEDWQVVIASPSPEDVGPQLMTWMSPVSDGSTPYVAFNLNFCDYPTFQAGGMQVKVCSGADVPSSSSQGTALCQTANETISWTQRLSIANSQATHEVVNGQSTTWGQFGSAQGLNPVSFTASITSLASYSPDTSVAKSGASWQSNRVATMTLLRVRYYSGGQLISTDNNARSVTLSVAGNP